VTERIALRQPRSLQPEQLGQRTVSTAAVPQRVSAWVVWEDGVEELVPAQAVAWTKRAVHVRFGAPPHQHEVWVWALAALGTRDGVLGEVFHVPNAPALTTRQIIDLIADELGSPIKVNVAPILLLRVMGLFNKTVREVDEMVYEFTQPFVVDGAPRRSLSSGSHPLR